MIFDYERLEFTPHPLAPQFSADSNPKLMIDQLIREMTSQNPNVTATVITLIREAGFVSLWFYLRCILGACGPYNLLDEHLHLAMCNFRQRVATTPGIKAAGFTPRSCYKSTIWSHGANSWELLRNPNLRIGMTSSIYERAFDFVQQIIANFSSNEFHRQLYPEWEKENRSTDKLILANRTRRTVEPSVVPITAGGSTQGAHFDIFNPDDIVGDDMLNAEHGATADMVRMADWLHRNLRTLVISWTRSRIMVVGTRYGLDDPYERVMLHSKEQIGYWKEVDYEIDPKGEWTTFYVPAIVNNESINPAAFSVDSLNELAKTDPWTYQSQYMNNPKAAKIGDLASYNPRSFTVDYDNLDETYRIYVGEDEVIDLRQCDVVMAADPAGFDGTIGNKSSRAAIAVVARDPRDRRFVLEAVAGYWPTTTMFDKMFEFKNRYGKLLRATFLETQGPFKSLLSILRQEQLRRGVSLNLVGIPALGNKEATIRNILQPILSRDLLYVSATGARELLDEIRAFPGRKMDLLDATKIAVFKGYRPEAELDEDDEPRARRDSRLLRQHVSSVTGY